VAAVVRVGVLRPAVGGQRVLAAKDVGGPVPPVDDVAADGVGARVHHVAQGEGVGAALLGAGGAADRQRRRPVGDVDGLLGGAAAAVLVADGQHDAVAAVVVRREAEVGQVHALG